MIKKLLKKLVNFVSSLWEHEKIEDSTDQTNADKFVGLQWTYGGFRAGNPVQVFDAIITDLKVKSNGMSYRWTMGGCELLGAANVEDASQTIACLFCLIGGKWLGGKFDWISTSRVTRDFKNIATGYHGWDACAIDKAEAYRFVILSKDGTRRTNVIEVKK
jgi:hypothetical protein